MPELQVLLRALYDPATQRLEVPAGDASPQRVDAALIDHLRGVLQQVFPSPAERSIAVPGLRRLVDEHGRALPEGRE